MTKKISRLKKKNASQFFALFVTLALVLATAASASSPADLYPARLRRSLFQAEADEAGEAGEAVGEADFGEAAGEA